MGVVADMPGMRSCVLCGSAEGELVGRRVIVVGEEGVCDGCRSELASLEKVYRRDFEERTGLRLKAIIPWPAFRSFTWPPNAAVITSGLDPSQREFAVGISDGHLVSGRRSLASLERELAAAKAERMLAVPGASLDQAELRGREVRRLDAGLDQVGRQRQRGERALFSIPRANLGSISATRNGQWVEVAFSHEVRTPRALGGWTVRVRRERWTVSAIYEPVVNELVSGTGPATKSI